MSEEDRDDAVRVHTVVCHNHLRDTMLRHRIKDELKALKETLAEALEEVRAEDRVTLDVQVICRAAAKEFLFSASGIYLDFEATAAGSGPPVKWGMETTRRSVATAMAATRRTRMTRRTRRTRTRIKMRTGAIKRKEKTYKKNAQQAAHQRRERRCLVFNSRRCGKRKQFKINSENWPRAPTSPRSIELCAIWDFIS